MKILNYLRITRVLIVVAMYGIAVFAQSPQQPSSTVVDEATRAAVIDALLRRLNANYVFPETAKKMDAAIREKAAKKEYDSITDAAALGRKLTEDLQSVSPDKHLRVFFSAQPLPARDEGRRAMTSDEREELFNFARKVNFGFERVGRLDGNVGYADVRMFFPGEMSGGTIAAVMNFLAATDALIVDLRFHNGGEPETVALFSSYFFNQPTHLNDLYWRADNSTQQFWTTTHLAGARYLNKPVYVLTSSRTFSGAEEFAYNLKTLKRATIVGETTKGGAHPAPVFRLNEHFGAQIPTGRAINPITKTNWEGIGVAPDITVSAEKAMKTAHLLAARELFGKEQNAEEKRRLGILIEMLQKEL